MYAAGNYYYHIPAKSFAAGQTGTAAKLSWNASNILTRSIIYALLGAITVCKSSLRELIVYDGLRHPAYSQSILRNPLCMVRVKKSYWTLSHAKQKQ